MGIVRGTRVAEVEALRRWTEVGRVIRTWGTQEDVRAGPLKPPGPCPTELQPLPFPQRAASLFMNIHDISILETQSPEKLPAGLLQM